MLDIDQEFNLCSRQKQFLLKDVLFQSEKKFFSYSSEPLELQLYKIEYPPHHRGTVGKRWL